MNQSFDILRLIWNKDCSSLAMKFDRLFFDTELVSFQEHFIVNNFSYT